MRFILFYGVLILGCIGIAPEVFAPDSAVLSDSDNEQIIVSDEALVKISSNYKWSGQYGHDNSINNVAGEDDAVFNFSCKQNDSYYVDFWKDTDDGYLILSIIQNKDLLDIGYTKLGHVKLSGKCHTSKIPITHDRLSISTDKESYLSGDTIKISGTAKLNPYTSNVNFKILNPFGQDVGWTETYHLKNDGPFTKDVKIKDNWRGGSGEYTVVVFFDDINNVTKKISITQKETGHIFKVIYTATKKEIENNDVLYIKNKYMMGIKITGTIDEVKHRDSVDISILKPDYSIVPLHAVLTDNGNYTLPQDLNNDLVVGCYEILANFHKRDVGEIKFFVTDKQGTQGDDSRLCKNALSKYLMEQRNEITPEKFRSLLKEGGWTDDQINNILKINDPWNYVIQNLKDNLIGYVVIGMIASIIILLPRLLRGQWSGKSVKLDMTIRKSRR